VLEERLETETTDPKLFLEEIYLSDIVFNFCNNGNF
jgi:hypothetical protein